MKKSHSLTMCATLLMVFFVSCGGRQSRLLSSAEALALEHPDSAATLLAQVDTTHLTTGRRALYDLTRALIHEEQWQRRHADTATCLHVYETTWEFKRKVAYETSRPFAIDAALHRAYLYYEHASFGGTIGENRKSLSQKDKTSLRRFGRLCYALSRHFSDSDTLLQADQLFHLAIHCAERSDDHATALRAYDMLGRHFVFAHNDYSLKMWAMQQALAHYRLQPEDSSPWLLTLVNDYGETILIKNRIDLHYFTLLVRAAEAAKARDTRTAFEDLDSISVVPFGCYTSYPIVSSSGSIGMSGENADIEEHLREVAVPIDMYEEAMAKVEGDDSKKQHCKLNYEYDMNVAMRKFFIQRRTYLAPGYVLQTTALQRRLLVAVIVILVLIVMLSVLFLQQMRRKHREERRQEAERRAEEKRLAEDEKQRAESMLRQKDTMIATLRGHLIDKSEIMEMLEPKAGKRTLVNAQNWREIELTLDAADNFVSRLRSEHPSFSEDDIRLCMLTRLRLSNTALSAIYVISVSAVQHRKQKLKKEGFGVTDPNITLDQIIANY
jgi:hypothetical protein